MRRQSNFSFPSWGDKISGTGGTSSSGAGAGAGGQGPGGKPKRGESKFSRARTYSVEFGRSLSHFVKEFSNRKGLTDKWYLVDPRNVFVGGWDIYMVILLLFTTIVTPFEVCFLSSDLIPVWLLVVNYVVDCSFFVDLLLNFNRMSFDENTGIPIADLKVIRSQYLRGYFFVDFISCLPFDQLAILFGAGDKAEALKILRLLKLVRLAKLVKMINSKELMQRAQEFFEFRHGTRRLLRFIFISMFISHFMACGWHVVARIEEPSDLEDGYSIFSEDEEGKLVHLNWITGYFNEYEAEPSYYAKYIVALYLSVMTVTTVGYGDVQPKTTGERVYLIIAMLFGASMQAYVVGSICGIISNLNQTSGEFNQVMDALNAFISENKIEPELARRLRSFIRYTKRSKYNFRKWQTVLQLMSPKLQQDAALAVNVDWMSKIELFQSAPKEMIVKIAFALKSVSFSPFEAMVMQGKRIDRLYIVTRGLVFKEGRIQGQNTLIGNEMLQSKYSLSSVSSLTFVDTNTIDYTDFQMILDKYPLVRAKLKRQVVQAICRKNVIRYAKAVNLMRDYSRKAMQECDTEAEAWAKILAHEHLRDFTNEGKMTVVRRSLDGTMELNKLIRVVCLIQRAFKRYKKRKEERIKAESKEMSLYNLKEMILQSEEIRVKQFQELKERMHRLSEQQYRLFSELLYQHKFAKST
ncbi:voltage-gated ion channel protein [Chloropicon primus]|uniref:Voltage-gated ion channel protein n=1 Tax=Chloropicon primus TaxID=1764295 RepID=A0A5B8MT81_9CHLO|nr:voltage-gated ion channel protein [Chloropicon primus]|eukprot:QDZ23601.1 voltage-gated ion channel protein [Chloropicon primus]